MRIVASLLTILSVTAASAQAQFPADSRLKTIAATKTIRIAARPDAPPYSFLSGAKEQIGYSIDVCTLVVGSMQKQLGLDQLKIEWVPVTVQTRFSTVADGKADMECGSSTVTLGMSSLSVRFCRSVIHATA